MNATAKTGRIEDILQNQVGNTIFVVIRKWGAFVHNIRGKLQPMEIYGEKDDNIGKLYATVINDITKDSTTISLSAVSNIETVAMTDKTNVIRVYIDI